MSTDMIAKRHDPCKLFVGQVPPTYKEEKLQLIFEEYGTVKEISILKDSTTGAHKGCAFVTFMEEESAYASIEALNRKITLDGARREMIVSVATPRAQEESREWKLYVGMLSLETTEDDLMVMFEPYGDVIEVYLMRQKDGISKGSAFVKYGTRDEALRAINALHEKIEDRDAGKLLKVRFAHTPQEKMFNLQKKMGTVSLLGSQSHSAFGQNVFHRGATFLQAAYNRSPTYNRTPIPCLPHTNINMATMGRYAFPTRNLPQTTLPKFNPQYGRMGYGLKFSPFAKQQHYQLHSQMTQSNDRGPVGANIFVYGIPNSYSNEDLGSLFSNFGTVRSSNVQYDTHGTKRNKGFGFVSFTNAESALIAINSMNGFMLESRRLEVRLKQEKQNTPY